MLTPGVMVQNCSLSVRHHSCLYLFEDAFLLDLNYQTILEMRFALSENVAVLLSFTIYTNDHIVLKIMWQSGSYCMPTLFLFRFKLAL